MSKVKTSTSVPFFVEDPTSMETPKPPRSFTYWRAKALQKIVFNFLKGAFKKGVIPSVLFSVSFYIVHYLHVGGHLEERGAPCSFWDVPLMILSAFLFAGGFFSLIWGKEINQKIKCWYENFFNKLDRLAVALEQEDGSR